MDFTGVGLCACRGGKHEVSKCSRILCPLNELVMQVQFLPHRRGGPPGSRKSHRAR